MEGKKVKLTLVGLDGNAFSLMGAFQKQARREKWTSEEIKTVTDKCMSGDYNNLLVTLMEVCEDEDEDADVDKLEDDNEDEDEDADMDMLEDDNED